MLRKSLGQYIRVVALLVMALAGNSAALAQQAAPASQAAGASVNGRNAMSATLGQDRIRTGDIRKAEGKLWVETDGSGTVVSHFQEVKRDDWSVFLTDHGRGVTLQLDLRTRLATFTDRTTRRKELYEIQAATTVGAPAQKQSSATQPEPRKNGLFRARQSPIDNSDSAPVPARAAAPAFCWNDTVARGAGTIPGRVADCPAGFTNDGATCKRVAETIPAPSRAADCPDGYNNKGSTCERAAATKANANTRPADCPDGFTNTGAACFRLSAPAPLGMEVMTCKAGETKLGGRCYKSCEAGYSSAGASCTRPASTLGADKMSCKAGYKKNGQGRCIAECAAGLTNTGDACSRPAQTLGLESMSCKAGEIRTGGRCVAAAGSCAKGEVLQGGLCYTACASGFDGVGSACWAQAPKSWTQCGMGSAKNAQACAAAVLDPVTAVKQTAVFVGLLGSGGAAQLPAMQKKFKELADAYGKAKDLPQFKKGQDAWEQASRGKDALSLDKMATAATEADMMRYATQLLAIVELSGGAANLDASPYPKCSKLPSSK